MIQILRLFAVVVGTVAAGTSPVRAVRRLRDERRVCRLRGYADARVLWRRRQRREMFRRYGIPNGIFTYELFGPLFALYIDDDRDGAPVAFASSLMDRRIR